MGISGLVVVSADDDVLSLELVRIGFLPVLRSASVRRCDKSDAKSVDGVGVLLALDDDDAVSLLHVREIVEDRIDPVRVELVRGALKERFFADSSDRALHPDHLVDDVTALVGVDVFLHVMVSGLEKLIMMYPRPLLLLHLGFEVEPFTEPVLRLLDVPAELGQCAKLDDPATDVFHVVIPLVLLEGDRILAISATPLGPATMVANGDSENLGDVSLAISGR